MTVYYAHPPTVYVPQPAVELYRAAERGDAATIHKLAAARTNLTWHHRDYLDGNTALHEAAKYGHSAAVQALLQAGADIGAKSKTGMTPLHVAAAYGQAGTAKVLLQEGAGVEVQAKEGRGTPLHQAALSGQVEVVQVLLRAGADVTAWESKTQGIDFALPVAALGGHVDVVRVLLKAGVHVCATTLKEGDSPLHLAARGGHVEVVEALLEAGADVGLANKAGKTPLDAAGRRWFVGKAQKARLRAVRDAITAVANRPPMVRQLQDKQDHKLHSTASVHVQTEQGLLKAGVGEQETAALEPGLHDCMTTLQD